MAVDASDLGEVDLLCRLALSAKRLGCRVHLTDVSPELRSLIELAGMDAVLLGPEETDLR
ncbi:MAG: STAS domain-containing protein [Acidimicrobiales bacterium]|nr:STAS domain-containing protein [Acidimicrobiales bacterium]